MFRTQPQAIWLNTARRLGLTTGVVTSNSRELTIAWLRRVVTSLIDIVIGGDDVNRSKVEPYLRLYSVPDVIPSSLSPLKTANPVPGPPSPQACRLFFCRLLSRAVSALVGFGPFGLGVHSVG